MVGRYVPRWERIAQKTQNPKQYLYPTLPEACYCHTLGCGYVLRNPGQHCRELRCEKCGARLWRVPP